jgi:hypothetical protein
LQEETHRLDTMRLAGSDVLLLPACGHGHAAVAQDLDVTNDGAKATVEQAEGEILVGEEAALLTGLGGEAEHTAAAEAADAAAGANSEVVVSGIEREPDRDLLAILECFAGRFVGGDGEKLDLAESELAIAILGVEGIDIFDGLQNRLRDEGGAVGAGFDTPAEQAVEGFGVEALLLHLLVERIGTDHGRHL